MRFCETCPIRPVVDELEKQPSNECFDAKLMLTHMMSYSSKEQATRYKSEWPGDDCSAEELTDFVLQEAPAVSPDETFGTVSARAMAKAIVECELICRLNRGASDDQGWGK